MSVLYVHYHTENQEASMVILLVWLDLLLVLFLKTTPWSVWPRIKKDEPQYLLQWCKEKLNLFLGALLCSRSKLHGA